MTTSLFFAVSLSLAAQNPQAASVWQQVQPSVAVIENTAGATGVAVLIDAEGLFLTHRNSVGSSHVRATMPGVGPLDLYLKNVDEQTQLALLQAADWSADSAPVTTVAPTTPARDEVLLLVTHEGPSAGQYVSGDRAGLLQSSQRFTPLSEIRFETSHEKVGGALAFDEQGRLVGVLEATLMPAEHRSANAELAVPVGAMRAGDVMGPVGLTVGYALGVEILQRVIAGFTSEERAVRHPSIGITFRDVPGGALIQAVAEGSAAAGAGLKAGMVVFGVNGAPISGAVNLATSLFRQEVGSTMQLAVRKGLERLLIDVKVGYSLPDGAKSLSVQRYSTEPLKNDRSGSTIISID